MSWPDLASNFFRAVFVLIGMIAMDYALLEGRTTRQVVRELEIMAGDVPVQLNGWIRDAVRIDWKR